MKVRNTCGWLFFLGLLAFATGANASGTRSSTGAAAGSKEAVTTGEEGGLMESGEDALDPTSEGMEGDTSESCSEGERWHKRAKKCVTKCEKGQRYHLKQEKCVSRKGKGKKKGMKRRQK